MGHSEFCRCAPNLPLALTGRVHQIRPVTVHELDGLFLVERRLRTDRRIGLQRRIGDRRQETAEFPVERRAVVMRRGVRERRSDQPRRIQIARLNFLPAISPDPAV